MENFEYAAPTKVIFGKDAELKVGKEIASRGYTKVMLVFGGLILLMSILVVLSLTLD